MSKICRVNFEGYLIPFGAKISDKLVSSKDESRLHQVGNRCFLESSWASLTCGGDGQVPCSSRSAKTSRTCQPPKCTSNGSNARTPYKEDIYRLHVQTELSESSTFSTPTGEMPAVETLWTMKQEEEDTVVEVHMLWSMRDGFNSSPSRGTSIRVTRSGWNDLVQSNASRRCDEANENKHR